MNIVSQWRWLARQFTRQLWLTALLYSIAAVITVLAGPLVQSIIPELLVTYINEESVDRVLGILASSMLAVTTFSLATMVSAHGAVISNTTPRASSLIIDDDITRNALGAFIGSFLFSLVGIVALSAGLYGEKGHVVLFIATVVVIVFIVATLLRWIDHLTRLAKVGEIVDKLENTTMRAIRQRTESPFLGGKPLNNPDTEIPDDAGKVTAGGIGYVQHIDMELLQNLLEDESADAKIFILATPGSYVSNAQVIARYDGFASESCIEKINNAFYVDNYRTFEYDPRFGLIVMSEVASRALSPAINDPGTAIDIIGRAVRILCYWAENSEVNQEPDQDAPKIFVEPLLIEDLFDDIFNPIARDGARMLSVQIRLQKAFLVLAELDGKPMLKAAQDHARAALELSESALVLAADKALLKNIAQQTLDQS